MKIKEEEDVDEFDSGSEKENVEEAAGSKNEEALLFETPMKRRHGCIIEELPAFAEHQTPFLTKALAGYHDWPSEKIKQYVLNWRFCLPPTYLLRLLPLSHILSYINDADDTRISVVDKKKGGIRCRFMKDVSKLRGAGWEIVKQIGRKILNGNFNLTKVSFPIKSMVPKTLLENAMC